MAVANFAAATNLSRKECVLSNLEMSWSSNFAGKRVLVVEDEFLLADETRGKLERLGAVVVGPTARVDDALLLIDRNSIDAAILDILLDGSEVFPVAERLKERGIPFVFASAFGSSAIPERFTGYVLCDKPLELENIARGLFEPRVGQH